MSTYIHIYIYIYSTIMYKKLENLNFLHSLDLQQFPFFKGSRLHVCLLSTYIYNFRYLLYYRSIEKIYKLYYLSISSYTIETGYIGILMAILGTMKKEPHNLPYIIIEVDSYYYIFFFDFENRNTYGIFKIRNTILHTYIHT